MFARFLLLCLLHTLFFHTSFANQSLLPHLFVPYVVPHVDVGPLPETLLRERLSAFFVEYGLSEDMRHAMEEGIVAQLLLEHGGHVSSINSSDFLPFLLDVLNIPSASYVDICDRVRTLAIADPCANLIHCIYESHEQGFAQLNPHAREVRRLMTGGMGLIEAYWLDYFRRDGLTEIQAQRAAHVICDFIKQKVSIKHAYWHSILMQFGFSESWVHARVLRAVALAQQGLSHSEILAALLFGDERAELANLFRECVAQGMCWVEAFYYAYYMQSLNASDLARSAAQVYVLEYDAFGFEPGRFERIIYEQYGFPRTIARAAAECMDRMQVDYPSEDTSRLFWWAGFRVLGVPEDAVAQAHGLMLHRVLDGYPLQHAFEWTYAEVMSEDSANQEAFFEALDHALFLREEGVSRIEVLLQLLWKTLYPKHSMEWRAGALRGFVECPATLAQILIMLKQSPD